MKTDTENPPTADEIAATTALMDDYLKAVQASSGILVSYPLMALAVVSGSLEAATTVWASLICAGWVSLHEKDGTKTPLRQVNPATTRYTVTPLFKTEFNALPGAMDDIMAH